LLRLMEAWRPAEEEQRRVEAERLAALWAGINVGDVVELSESEHVRRGGMLMMDADGGVHVRQGEIVAIDGERACVKAIEYWGRFGLEWIDATEWVGRGSIGRVVKAGLGVVKEEKGDGRRYWEAG